MLPTAPNYSHDENEDNPIFRKESNKELHLVTGMLCGSLIGIASGLCYNVFQSGGRDLSQVKKILDRLDPKPQYLFIDPQLINAFDVLAFCRDMGEKAYRKSLLHADTVCCIAWCLDTNYNRPEDQKYVPDNELMCRAVEAAEKCIAQAEKLYKNTYLSYMSNIKTIQQQQEIREFYDQLLQKRIQMHKKIKQTIHKTKEEEGKQEKSSATYNQSYYVPPQNSNKETYHSKPYHEIVSSTIQIIVHRLEYHLDIIRSHNQNYNFIKREKKLAAHQARVDKQRERILARAMELEKKQKEKLDRSISRMQRQEQQFFKTKMA